MKSTFEKMGGTYTLGADGIYYPNLVSTDERTALWEIWNDAENISERASSGNVFTVYAGRQTDRTSEYCGR